MVYNKFSEYLKNRYGTKVYKLPVSLGTSCPNRDGTIRMDAVNGDRIDVDHANGGRTDGNSAADAEACSGCIFCGIVGAGFDTLPPDLSIRSQLEKNRDYIGAKFGTEKFIAYFQNFSNTYVAFDKFTRAMNEACIEGIVAVYIGTRPDCIDDRRVDFLKQLKEEKGVDIVLELGLQSVNHHTLRWLNRGHGLAEFIDAVLRIKRAGLEVCAHMINDLPADDINDVIEAAKVLSALGTDQVKCHSLYILENTALGKDYKEGRFTPLSMDEFIERTISFLEYLDPDIVIQRLIGRSPEGRSLFCNWYTSWWKIHDAIVEKMRREGRYQGRLFSYLYGSALKRFNDRTWETEIKLYNR
jgi:radical SAM protein (TIGR01212 family)